MDKPAPTAARTRERGSSHYYSLEGLPCFEIEKKDKTGKRPTTLADARKNNWLPSCTTILKLLHREALVNWQIEQAALAVLTTPKKEAEALDAFVQRVLHEEGQQDQERDAAAALGREIHDGIECFFSGETVPEKVEVYCRPVINHMLTYGEKASSEVILVGDDYAGCTDLIQDCKDYWGIVDFKSSKNLPDPNKGGAWVEHRLQLAAYARAFYDKLRRAGDKSQNKPIIVRNVYISTTKPGEFVVCEHEDWESAYEAFAALVKVWQWKNQYRPNNPKRMPSEATVAEATKAMITDLTNRNEAMKKELGDLTMKYAELAKQSQPTTEPMRAMPRLMTPEPVDAEPVLTPGEVTPLAMNPDQSLAEQASQGYRMGKHPLPKTIGGKKVRWTPGIPSNP